MAWTRLITKGEERSWSVFFELLPHASDADADADAESSRLHPDLDVHSEDIVVEKGAA